MNYLDVIGNEIRRAVSQDAMPDGETTDLFRFYALLLLAKGEAVTREDVHNAWVAWMLSKGEVHSSLVPFSELDKKTQAEDSPFMLAIKSVARTRMGRT